MSYDAFISYSHTADGLLAPRLQSALQRFAKPWWKRRAIRVFRDESSLSANPHLWSSITAALDASAWFVLLLSPDAASSPWVNDEVAYWLQHKPADRILPVVSEGEFGPGILPPALAFDDEPRWVDLRFARSEDQLDLKNPTFSAAIADIASAVRGIPKDELESEEVRQHRRTIRTAWAAASVVLIFGVAAAIATIIAFGQAARADAEAGQARGRELILEAEKSLEVDPELSAHLALAAIEAFRSSAVEVPVSAAAALRDAIAANRVVARVPGGRFVAVSDDGSMVATADGDGVAIWDDSLTEVEQRFGRGGAVSNGAAFSPDGRLLAVSFQGVSPSVTVWDLATERSFDLGFQPTVPNINPLVFSPNGQYLAIDTFADTKPTGIEVWSLEERRLVHRVEDGSWAGFTGAGFLTYAFSSGERSGVRVVDPATGAIVEAFPEELSGFGWYASWSPDGSRIALPIDRDNVVVLDSTTHNQIAMSTQDRVWRPEWLRSGEAFVVGGESGLRMIDGSTGDLLLELKGQDGGTWHYQIVPGTDLIVSGGFGGETVLFDASPVGGVELGGWPAPTSNAETPRFIGTGERVLVLGEASVFTAGAIDGSDPTEPIVGLGGDEAPSPIADADGALTALTGIDRIVSIRKSHTGEVVYEALPGSQIYAIGPDGDRAVIDSKSKEPCLTQLVSTAARSDPVGLGCWGEALFSPDGQLVVTMDYVGTAALFDPATGALLVTLSLSDHDNDLGAWLVVGFSADGATLLVGGQNGVVHFFDVAALLAGASLGDSALESLVAHENLLLAVTASPQGTYVGTRGRGEPLKIWDLETARLHAQFDGVRGFDFHPTLPRVAVVTSLGAVRIHTLDLAELVEIGRSRLSRSLSLVECETYRIDPCATSLGELHEGS